MPNLLAWDGYNWLLLNFLLKTSGVLCPHWAITFPYYIQMLCKFWEDCLTGFLAKIICCSLESQPYLKVFDVECRPSGCDDFVTPVCPLVRCATAMTVRLFSCFSSCITRYKFAARVFSRYVLRVWYTISKRQHNIPLSFEMKISFQSFNF